MTATDEDLRAFGSLEERTPPHDVPAEQSVLGGMMLSKDAIADVIEAIRGNDFYRPQHEMIFEAVVDLYGRGQPTDVVAVADALQRTGELTPGRRARLPAHAHLVGADGGERGVLRGDRA